MSGIAICPLFSKLRIIINTGSYTPDRACGAMQTTKIKRAHARFLVFVIFPYSA